MNMYRGKKKAMQRKMRPMMVIKAMMLKIKTRMEKKLMRKMKMKRERMMMKMIMATMKFEKKLSLNLCFVI